MPISNPATMLASGMEIPLTKLKEPNADNRVTYGSWLLQHLGAHGDP